MMNTLKPVGKNILLRVIKGNGLKGIILPDNAQSNPDLCRFYVQDIGDEVTKVNIGDEVMFLPRALEIKVENIEPEIFIIKEEQLLGIVKPIEAKVL